MNILVASQVDPDALAVLEQRHDVVRAIGARQAELLDLIVDRHAIVLRSGIAVTRELLDSAPRLELIVRAGSGIDNIDLAAAEARDVSLVRIPEPGAQAVAELAIALMLALARQVLVADRLLRAGHWAKQEIRGHLLHGKVLGVVGAGNIGTRVGQLGMALGMGVVGCIDPASAQAVERYRELGIHLTSLDEVLGADFVSVHVPLQPGTRGLIGARELAVMKPGAFLVNLSRGGVVDERALHAALATGRLGGAALDVHEREGEGEVSPLAGLSNVVLTPHIGATTVDTQREIGRRVLEAIAEHETRRGADGRVPLPAPDERPAGN